MDRLLPAGLYELLQRETVGSQRTLQQHHGLARRESVGLEAGSPASSAWFGPRSLTAMVVTQSRKGVLVSRA